MAAVTTFLKCLLREKLPEQLEQNIQSECPAGAQEGARLCWLLEVVSIPHTLSLAPVICPAVGSAAGSRASLVFAFDRGCTVDCTSAVWWGSRHLLTTYWVSCAGNGEPRHPGLRRRGKLQPNPGTLKLCSGHSLRGQDLKPPKSSFMLKTSHIVLYCGGSTPLQLAKRCRLSLLASRLWPFPSQSMLICRSKAHAKQWARSEAASPLLPAASP